MPPRRPARKMTVRTLESLDERIVPSKFGGAAGEAIVAAKGGPTLGSIYQQYVGYEQAGGTGAFSPTQAGSINVKGTSVEVDLRFGSGSFNTLVGQLRGVGMQVVASVPGKDLVEGYVPISQLPTVLSNSHEVGVSPVYKPTFLVKVPTPTSTTATTSTPKITAVATSTALSKASGPLNTVLKEYESYVAGGSKGAFLSSQTRIVVEGDSVGVDIRVKGGSLNAVVGELKGIGMTVSAVSSAYGIVEGSLPISELTTVNNNSQVLALLPIYRPTF